MWVLRTLRSDNIYYNKMADPKYANLPGIDLNSPDVYETEDLPEEDQPTIKDQVTADDSAVEKIPLDTKTAFSTFKGKVVDSSGLDFSDRISKTRRTGYAVGQDEYEMLEHGSRTAETPQQKYQRLQHEIRELAEEVSEIKDNIKDEKSSENLSPVAMGKQVEYLKHQLADLHLEKLLGPEASVDLADPQGAIKKRLLTQLDAYKPSQGEKTKPPGKGDHVLYELYYKPEQAQFSKNARLASLEERLDRLAAVIGQNTGKMGMLTTDTENKSLVGAMSVLNTKLSLLDPANIEQVETRLQGVLHKLGQIAEKKPVQEDVDKEGKISELYTLVKKWQAAVN
ncbi:dynactin subunit 2-like isoform X2 [Gigantopelta aegis]|uniref:dynactin subunit 2-like isoform X2 n=1 Tax=Gigantopelta aegis TaxID=1735272 RepID=UPI001B88A643|nr:dynactin subunit 2-like isoform X2 [Gigantopelta aegis]